jgi:hypothetical protein
MKQNTLTKILLAIALLALPAMVQAQVKREPAAIVVAGGDVGTTNGSLSISCGEVAVSYSNLHAVTVVNMTESFQEGVQQPETDRDRAYAHSQLLKLNPLSIEVSIYPNPTTEDVVIESSEATEALVYTLYSPEGRIISTGKHFDGKTTIPLSQYASGSYMLQVSSPEKKESNSYKIIKIQ